MELRYLGFDQRENSRVYRFDVRMDARLTKQASVAADMAAFRDHRVSIQEGPVLSGQKLTSDLERGWEGEHELTAADVRAFADAQAHAEARRAGARKPARRRHTALAKAQPMSPWRNTGAW